MGKMTREIIMIAVLLIGIVVTAAVKKTDEKTISYARVKKVKQNPPVITDTTSFSPENLKLALEQVRVSNPDIVYKQAILETGTFTSAIFIENNNLFGMKHPYVRSTTSLGKNRGHAKYASWFQSVKDMKLFQIFYRPRIEYMHNNNYYNFLDDVYASDKWYTHKLRNIDV
jgi:hypothetical protein